MERFTIEAPTENCGRTDVTGADHELPFPRPNSPAGSDVDEGAPLARPRWQRALLLVAGSVALALAVLGIFLPLLPTTPLVLVAAFFFARGSERAHGWLLRNRVFGRIVREWQQHRRVPIRAKWTAIALVFATFALSVLVVPNGVYGYATLFVVGSGLIVFLATLPTSPRSARRSRLTSSSPD